MTVRMTLEKSVMSPKTTLTWSPKAAKDAEPGLMSMQTISSPRSTSLRITLGPINPVPPITRIGITVSYAELGNATGSIGRCPNSVNRREEGARV